MSVFSRGTASRSRVRTVIGGIAIAGASALVLAGCAGGGGDCRALGVRRRPLRTSPSRSAPLCRRPATWPSSARPKKPAWHTPHRSDQRGDRRHRPDPRRRLRRLGRHRQQGLRDRDPPPPGRRRLRDHRRRVLGHVAAVHRPGRRRRRHPVLAGQHLRRVHDVRGQRPVLPHRSVGRAPGRGARQPDRRGRTPDARHDRAERLVRHRSGRLRHGGLRGRRRRGRRGAHLQHG